MSLRRASLFNNDLTALSPSLIAVANQEPELLLEYIIACWDEDESQALENPLLLNSLKQLSVLLADGTKHALAGSWLPERKLMFICGRYMLPEERFPFLKHKNPLSRSQFNDKWASLATHLQLRLEDDLHFYLQILESIREQSRKTMSVEIPRRILELYLRIKSILNSATGNVEEMKANIISSFRVHELILAPTGGWKSPEDCVLKPFLSSINKLCVLPLPATWEATPKEQEEVVFFYKDVLEISTKVSYLAVLDRLQELSQPLYKRATKEVATNILYCYEYLETLVDELGPRDAANLRSALIDKAYIADLSDHEIRWYKSTDCAWSYGVKLPGYFDLSESYSSLKSFFTEFLQVKELPVGRVYRELLNIESNTASVDAIKQLLHSFSNYLSDYGDFLDVEPFLEANVFPVRQVSGKVHLASSESEFYIVDRAVHRKQFSGKLEMLDFSPFEVWMLEPLWIWAGMEVKYLSWNIEETTYMEGRILKPIDLSFSAQTSCGLLRLGSHYRSPRVRTSEQRQSLRGKIERAQFCSTDQMRLQFSVTQKSTLIVVDNLEAQIHLKEDDDRLQIFLPEHEEARDESLASRLPHELVSWLMTDPATEMIERVDERAVSLVKTILNVRPSLVERILDEADIVRLEDLEWLEQVKTRIDDLEAIHKSAPNLSKASEAANAMSVRPKISLKDRGVQKDRSSESEVVPHQLLHNLRIEDAEEEL